jgi:hypothetical protein
MLETLVTSETRATIVMAISSGTSSSSIDQVRCEVRSASNGSHGVNVPSERKYQPYAAPESPSARSAATLTSHIAMSAAGMAKADFTHRRSANNTPSTTTAPASFAASAAVQ